MELTLDLLKIINILLSLSPPGYKSFLEKIKKNGTYTIDQQTLLNLLRHDYYISIVKNFNNLKNSCLDIDIKTVHHILPRTKGTAKTIIMQKARYGKSPHLQGKLTIDGISSSIEPTHQKYYIRNHKFTHFDV